MNSIRSMEDLLQEWKASFVTFFIMTMRYIYVVSVYTVASIILLSKLRVHVT